MKTIRKYGWKPQLPDIHDLKFSLELPVGQLPPSTDLRAQFPAVYDQGDLGSCTANAIAGCIEFDFIKETHPDFVPSRLFIYYNERVLEHDVKQDNGAQIRDGIKTVVKQGVCDEKLWPYITTKFAKKPTNACYKAALKDIVTKYEALSTVAAYKSALAQGYPFAFGFSVYESFESDAVAANGIVPMPGPNEQLLGGHAVAAAGYDDAKQWFIVRNSWSPEWGDKGYFYLPYAYFTPSLTSDFWVIYTVK
jgi:C1A family cysteine protease